MGVLVKFEGRERGFWYPCADKRQAVTIVHQHCESHQFDDRSKVTAYWVTQWVDGKPVDAETIAF